VSRRAALALAAAAFLIHAALLRHFLIDDAFIVYRVARNLAAGLGPVFNPGERVEAFSCPLFTFLLAPIARVAAGDDVLPWIARGVGVAAGLGSLAVLATFELPGGRWATALALFFCAVSTSFTLWSVGGLETSLYALLILTCVRLALARPTTSGDQAWLGLVLAAVALSRPEGALPGTAVLAWRWLDPGTRHERQANLLVLPCAALPPLAYLAFRLAYYGQWVPNTYFAKHSPLALAIPAGLRYLASFVLVNGGWAFYAPVAYALMSARRSRVLALAALVIAAYLPYVVIVGGDWMDAHRFLAPILPLLAILIASGWASVLDAVRAVLARRRLARVSAALVPAGAVLLVAWQALANVPGTRLAREAPYVNAYPYYVTIGRLAGWVAPPAWRVATDDIGAIGWYAHVRVIDMLGLANPDVAHRRKAQQDVVADAAPEILVMHYDDSARPQARWRRLKIAGFDTLYVRPRAPVPLPGSFRALVLSAPDVEARLAALPPRLKADLVALDAYLHEHQPDMKPIPAGVAP
jgi:hypothetical protein